MAAVEPVPGEEVEPLGTRIRRLRQTAGISGRELARRADLSQPYVNQLEHGKRTNISMGAAASIALALEVDPQLLTPYAFDAPPALRLVDLAAENGKGVTTERSNR